MLSQLCLLQEFGNRELTSMIFISETINDMRTHIPHHRTCGAHESEKIGCDIGKSNLSIRHQQHEIALYHRDLAKSQR